ncbi:hypothetical protein LDENG_00069850 [Lucifuga dentata]|nr:hypothetical protein LDENG_00069850 [Lucifuga dentata]
MAAVASHASRAELVEMSRPRSRSPHYRNNSRRHDTAEGRSQRFPWEEPDFDPNKVLAELDGIPSGRSPNYRGDFEENRSYLWEEMLREDERRSPPFPDGGQFRQHYQDMEFHHRSPHHPEMSYTKWRLSPGHDAGGEDRDRWRGGPREHIQSFDNRERPPHSPLRLSRETLPLGMGWKKEQRGRGRGRSRDLSPRLRSEDHRGGVSREGWRRDAQGLNRGRRRENPPQERNHPFKRHKSNMDATHLGYGKEEEFGEQPYSVERPRDGFEGDAQGGLSHRDLRHSRPIVIDHDHGMTNSRAQWEQFDDLVPDDFDRQSRPHQRGSSQERFRNSNSRSDIPEGMREHFQDSWRGSGREARISPVQQDRTNPMGFVKRNGPMNHRGRSGPHPAKGRFSRGQSERPGMGQPRTHPHFPQSPQRHYDTQDLPHEHQRQGYRPHEDDCYEGPIAEEPDWEEGGRPQQWERDRPGSMERQTPRDELDLKMPHQRQRSWDNQDTNNMTVVTEETLTIKVDMSRPVNQNSLLCYSSDRQLSLDLVNVGRQRLDFLPMLEHSGMYRESPLHTGTFAQEIITLVHHVKEQYFRDDGVTLNERFSAPQQGSYHDDGTEEMTLDERFSSNRGFSLNMNMLVDDEPLFPRSDPMESLGLQPVRGPGPVSEQSDEYGDRDEMAEGDGGFSGWSEEQCRRGGGGNTGPRRGGSYRPNTGPQRRNNRLSNRLGPMRRHNNHNNAAGAGW